MIHYQCPKCSGEMTSPDSMASQREVCPACGNVTFVPAIQAPAPPLSQSRMPTKMAAPNAIRASSPQSEYSGRVVTTERTSKSLKGQLVLSVLLIISGVVAAIVAWNTTTGLVLALFALCAGVPWFLITRIRIWWHHG